MRSNPVLAILLSLLCATAAQAKTWAIRIEHPYVRATPSGASTGAAFMTIHNDGQTDDMLLGGVSAVAKTVQVHEMTMDGGIMRMRQVQGGLMVPAAGAIELRPGGYHIMMIGLRAALKKGQSFPLTLHFKKAGDVSIEVPVRGLSGE